MRPVEQHRPRPVNPDASHYLHRPGTQDGGCASVVYAPRGPCGRDGSAGSAGRHLAARRHAPGVSTPRCSSAGRGRNGCTAGPGCGNVRTGTGGRDGPCAPRANRSAGRTRPSGATLSRHRLHRHGVGRGAVVKLPGQRDRCRAHLLRLRARLYRARGCDPGRRMPDGPDSLERRSRSRAAHMHCPPTAAPRLPGRPAGRPGRRTTIN